MRSISDTILRATLIGGFCARGAVAQDQSEVVWRYPSEEGLTFYERDAVTVSYNSDIENPSLWTFCREGDNGEDVNFKGRVDNAAPRNGSQLVQITFNTNSDNCWFNLRNNDEEGGGFNSPSFSLSSNERSQTTLGLIETTSSAAVTEETSSSRTTSSERETATGDNSSDENTNEGSGSSGGLSTGAKAGIGAGIGVGVLGILAFVGVFFMLRRKKAASREDDRPELQGTTVVEHKQRWEQLPQTPQVPQELSAQTEAERRAQAHEMP